MKTIIAAALLALTATLITTTAHANDDADFGMFLDRMIECEETNTVDLTACLLLSGDFTVARTLNRFERMAFCQPILTVGLDDQSTLDAMSICIGEPLR